VVSSFDLLAVIALTAGVVWAMLALWLIGERTLYDAARQQVEHDSDALLGGTVDPRVLSRRRLRRIALGSLRVRIVVGRLMRSSS
jgi:hypothetical protein